MYGNITALGWVWQVRGRFKRWSSYQNAT